MKLLLYQSILFLAILFQTGLLRGQIRDSAAIDSIFAEWDKPDVPGCALGVIQEGELVYARGYGMANLEYDIPNTPKSVFRIASTSKQFTAACIILLAQQGKLSLDQTLDRFFPDFPEYAKGITIRHLLNHTSGIRDYLVLASLKGYPDTYVYTDRDIMHWLVRQESLNFTPGDEHLYSNSGYWLLGQIVNQSAGEDMAEFARKNLFEPLGMSQTHFHNDHTRIVRNRASGYIPDHTGGFRISMTTLDMIGDGGIFTTVEDLKKWDDAFYDSGILNEKFWREMTRRGILNNRDTIDYACGLSIGNYKGLKTISHGGAFVGYRANLIRFPEQKFSVALLANRGDARMALAYRVADLLLADEFPEETVTRLPEEKKDEIVEEIIELAMDQLTGNYEVEPGIILNVDIEGDSLHVTQTWNNSSFNMARISGNTFQVPDFSALSFIFSEPDNGSAGILTVDFSGDKTVCKRKKEIDTSGINLEEYSGDFYSTELDMTYTLYVGDGTLKLQVGLNDPVDLRIDDTDRFTSREVLYRFTRENGRISGFEMDAGRVKNIRFEKEH